MTKQVDKDSPVYKELLNGLSLRRQNLALTQSKVASLVGFKNDAYVNLLERNKSPIPIQRLDSIAKIYKVNPYMLKKTVLVSRLPKEWDVARLISRYDPNFGKKTENEIEKEISRFINGMAKTNKSNFGG